MTFPAVAIGRLRSRIDGRTEIVAHARDELRALWTMYRDRLVREVSSPDGPGSVIVLGAESAEDAASALAALPFVVSKIIEFEVIELRPFAAFEMLCSEAEQP